VPLSSLVTNLDASDTVIQTQNGASPNIYQIQAAVAASNPSFANNLH
jgi:hypothetical protein